MSHQPNVNRRAAIRRSLGVAAGAAVFAPTSWKKPVIENVLLPAHAQTSPPPEDSTPLFGSITGNPVTPALGAASSESRTPSGGAPGGPTVDALSSVTMTGCVTVAGTPVTCTAVADLGGTTVNLGSATGTAAADGSFATVINVPATAIAPTAAIVSISITCTLTTGAVSGPTVFTPAQLSAALAGTASPASC